MYPGPNTPLGVAHFTVIGVPPLELVKLAAHVGYASIGLRLHPAFAGAPFYELRRGTEASREMLRRLRGEGISVYDIEFVAIDAAFSAAALKPIFDDAAELGARRLSVCGDDADGGRLVGNFAELCRIAAEFCMGVDIECMAWRSVSSLPLALEVIEAADQPNGGLLIDALHLSRTGGRPDMLGGIAPAKLRSAQLCDASADIPVGEEAIMKEARSGRLPPGQGRLPLLDLVRALPQDAVVSVEVPMAGETSAEEHARRTYVAARDVLHACPAAGSLARSPTQ